MPDICSLKRCRAFYRNNIGVSITFVNHSIATKNLWKTCNYSFAYFVINFLYYKLCLHVLQTVKMYFNNLISYSDIIYVWKCPFHTTTTKNDSRDYYRSIIAKLKSVLEILKYEMIYMMNRLRQFSNLKCQFDLSNVIFVVHSCIWL